MITVSRSDRFGRFADFLPPGRRGGAEIVEAHQVACPDSN